MFTQKYLPPNFPVYKLNQPPILISEIAPYLEISEGLSQTLRYPLIVDPDADLLLYDVLVAKVSKDKVETPISVNDVRFAKTFTFIKHSLKTDITRLSFADLLRLKPEDITIEIRPEVGDKGVYSVMYFAKEMFTLEQYTLEKYFVVNITENVVKQLSFAEEF